MAMKKISITDVKGFRLGNAENTEKGTGCTVIVCEEGAVGGVDVRGGGPATRETDLLRSENTVNSVNAVVLSGGSAFGLEAASGVMRELADLRIGFDAGDDIVVPIVCGASLYDLPVGEKAFPDVNMGVQAVRNAFDGYFAGGNHGAGTGATVGKIKGYGRAMKSGLGTFACGDGYIEVGAVAAVNAVGDIYNGAGNIIAGLRSEDGKTIYGTIKTLKNMVHNNINPEEEDGSHAKKLSLDEALAAAAKQLEEEEEASKQIAEVVPEVPEDSEAVEVIAEEPAPQAAEQAPAFIYKEIPAEAAPEAEAEPEATEDYVETSEPEIPEEAECEISEEPEEIYEPEEEFIPETPEVDNIANSFMEYAEISIPAVSEETGDDTEESEETEAFEEPVELIEEEPEPEFIEEEPAEEAETFEEPVEIIEEEPEQGYIEEAQAEETEAFEETAEIVEDESAEVIDDEPEFIEESHAEIPEEIPYESEEALAEETVEEVVEESVLAEEPEEEIIEVETPVVLSREEMGYDITFNTTISCLITNAALTKSQANKLASILHDAYARAIKPVHGTLDGDTVFVLATGKQEVNFDAFAALATDIMQYAIIDGAMSAEGAYGLPAARDI